AIHHDMGGPEHHAHAAHTEHTFDAVLVLLAQLSGHFRWCDLGGLFAQRSGGGLGGADPIHKRIVAHLFEPGLTTGATADVGRHRVQHGGRQLAASEVSELLRSWTGSRHCAHGGLLGMQAKSPALSASACWWPSRRKVHHRPNPDRKVTDY